MAQVTLDLGNLRVLLFTSLTLVVIVLGLYSAAPRLILPRQAHAASVTIWLVGNTSGWNYTLPSGINPTVTVSEADAVTIHLSASDTAPHQFYVDIDSNASPDCTLADLCSQQFSNTNPTTYSWNPGAAPHGTYTYYCSIHPGPMHGTFRVLQAPSGPDFTVSSNPSSLTISQGSFKTTTISVTSKDNFSGPVSLQPVAPSGITAKVNPTSVTPPKNMTVTATLNVTVSFTLAPGSYQVTVTGYNATTQRPTTVTVQVLALDFSVSSNTNSLSLVQGSKGTFTITTTSLNGFSGNVSLPVRVIPCPCVHPPGVSPDVGSVRITPGASASLTFNVSTTGTTAGDYTIAVVAQGLAPSGALIVHPLNVTLTVSSIPPPISPFSPLVISGIVAAIAITAAVIYIVRRRAKTNRDSSSTPNSPG